MKPLDNRPQHTTPGSWHEAVQGVTSLLAEVSFRDRHGIILPPDKGFTKWVEWALKIKHSRQTVYLIGNGASASMASHLAADLAKNGGLHTQVFSDLSLITAISNDLGYEAVFAEPLRRRACEGDMLVAISSSGNSSNITRAVETACSQGVRVVTLSAMAPTNRLRGAGDLNIYVPAKTYSQAETCHAAILHHWMDLVQWRQESHLPVGEEW